MVLTHGAWAARERHFRRAFAVCTDFMVVTEPIPELIEQIGWTSHMGVADLREMLYYLRRTADDRIAIGGGAMGIVRGARIRGRVLTAPRLAAMAAHGLTWLFPQLEGVRFDAAWSGPMDITGPGLPFFETAPGGNVHAGLGFSGHGLTSTRLGGKILGLAGAAAPTTSGAACRSSARRSRSCRRSRCAGRWCRRPASPTRPATARTSRDGARVCFLARSSPPTAATRR